jgi:NADH:ubiquinone oxidoreductase subunit 3 (subunit A)
MDQTWITVFVYLTMAMSVGFAMLLGAKLLGVRQKAPPPTRDLTYECGEEPEGRVWIRFHPRYYVVALIFVLFDVETVFLVPWALNTQQLGVFATVEMIIFALILLLAWAYALRKGAFKWQ